MSIDLEDIDNFNETFDSLDTIRYMYHITLSSGGTTSNEKTPNIATYTNIYITSPLSNNSLKTTLNPNGVYNCWCADVYDNIALNTDYEGQIVSMLDPAILNSTISSNPLLTEFYGANNGHQLYLTHFGAVLYIINKVCNDNTIYNTYTVGDIQTCIWTLLSASITYNQSTPYSGSLITHSSASISSTQNVLNLINESLFVEANNNITNIPLLFNNPTMCSFVIGNPGYPQIMLMSCQLNQFSFLSSSGGDPHIQTIDKNMYLLDKDIKFVNLLSDKVNNIYINAECSKLKLNNFCSELYSNDKYRKKQKIKDLFTATYYRQLFVKCDNEYYKLDVDTLNIIYTNTKNKQSKIKITNEKVVNGIWSIKHQKYYPINDTMKQIKININNKVILTVTSDIKTDERHHISFKLFNKNVTGAITCNDNQNIINVLHQC